jgi:hypothetical protein
MQNTDAGVQIIKLRENATDKDVVTGESDIHEFDAWYIPSVSQEPVS